MIFFFCCLKIEQKGTQLYNLFFFDLNFIYLLVFSFFFLAFIFYPVFPLFAFDAVKHTFSNFFNSLYRMFFPFIFFYCFRIIAFLCRCILFFLVFPSFDSYKHFFFLLLWLTNVFEKTAVYSDKLHYENHFKKFYE